MENHKRSSGFIRERQLIGGASPRIPIVHSTLWRWIAEGRFPKPVSLGPRTTAWPVEAIEEWEAERIASAQRGGE